MVPHKEFHVRPHGEDSHSVPLHISIRRSNGSCPRGSSIDGPRDKVRIQSAQVGTPLTWIVRSPLGDPPAAPEKKDSHGVSPPISAHLSHGSRPIGSTTDGSNGRGRMASLRIFRHTPDADRAPQGAPPVAPMGKFAWSPRARFVSRLALLIVPLLSIPVLSSSSSSRLLLTPGPRRQPPPRPP